MQCLIKVILHTVNNLLPLEEVIINSHLLPSSPPTARNLLNHLTARHLPNRLTARHPLNHLTAASLLPRANTINGPLKVTDNRRNILLSPATALHPLNRTVPQRLRSSTVPLLSPAATIRRLNSRRDTDSRRRRSNMVVRRPSRTPPRFHRSSALLPRATRNRHQGHTGSLRLSIPPTRSSIPRRLRRSGTALLRSSNIRARPTRTR